MKISHHGASCGQEAWDADSVIVTVSVQVQQGPFFASHPHFLSLLVSCHLSIVHYLIQTEMPEKKLNWKIILMSLETL